jgi:hypothetical protein
MRRKWLTGNIARSIPSLSLDSPDCSRCTHIQRSASLRTITTIMCLTFTAQFYTSLDYGTFLSRPTKSPKSGCLDLLHNLFLVTSNGINRLLAFLCKARLSQYLLEVFTTFSEISLPLIFTARASRLHYDPSPLWSIWHILVGEQNAV